MIVDFASLLHMDEPIRDLGPEIEGLLLADCAQHIVTNADGSFLLNARPVSSLRRMNNMLSMMRGARFEPVSTVQVAGKGVLTLDKGIRTMLVDAGVTTPFKYLVTSDTMDRVFRITFFPATQPVVWCTIRHADMKGALESITDALQRAGITILCSLNRVQEHLGKNWFEAVLSSHAWRVPLSGGHAEPAEIVRQILDAPEMHSYDLSVFFDHAEANSSMLQPEVATTNQGQFFVLKREDVDQWLNAKEAELARVSNDLEGIDSRDRYNNAPSLRHARALRTGIAQVRRETARLKRRIFISIEFTTKNEPKIAAVERACRQEGITYDVVRTPKDQRIIWEEVIDRMRDTTDLIAIWTPSIKAPPPSKRPSPWCVWELGIANALGLTPYVFADHTADLADYKLIHGSEFYYEFKTAADFQTKIAAVVQTIARTGDATRIRPRYSV